MTQRGSAKATAISVLFPPYTVAFSGEGDTARTCAHSSETGNGIGVGCLLADVRFLVGVKASLLETILWGGSKLTKCFSRLLAFLLKTEGSAIKF